MNFLNVFNIVCIKKNFHSCKRGFMSKIEILGKCFTIVKDAFYFAQEIFHSQKIWCETLNYHAKTYLSWNFGG